MVTRTEKLRAILNEPGITVTPCCFDAFSARLVERAGFPLTFMSGFSVAATRLAAPDTGLISYAEMLDQGRNAHTGTGRELLHDPKVIDLYLGTLGRAS